MISTLDGPLTTQQLAELWVDPGKGRDLFWGVGGKLAVFSTVFLVGALWVIESFEPETQKRFEVSIKAGKDTDALRPKIERILDRHSTGYELRTSSDDEVCYDVSLPIDVAVDDVTNALLRLDPDGHAAVNWSEKKARAK